MTGTKEILVGLNDSNSSRAALGWAANEAGSAELPLRAQGEAGPILVRAARQPSMLVIGGRILARPANDESGLVGRYCLHHLPGALVVTGEDGGWKPGDVESAMTLRAYNG